MDPDIQQNIQYEQSEQRRKEREQYKQLAEKKPWQDERGVQSVMRAVRDVEFPKNFDDLKSSVGDREVYTSGDKKFPMNKILDKLDQKVNPEKEPVIEGKVPSIRDFQTMLQRHWGAIEFMETPEDQRPEHGGYQPQEKDRPTSGQ